MKILCHSIRYRELEFVHVCRMLCLTLQKLLFHYTDCHTTRISFHIWKKWRFPKIIFPFSFIIWRRMCFLQKYKAIIVNVILYIFKQFQSSFRDLFSLDIIWNKVVISIHAWQDSERNRATKDSDMVKHELRVTSWKLKSTSWSSKARVKIQKHELKFKSTSYEFKSTSYKFESTSYEFESTSSRIIKSLKP